MSSKLEDIPEVDIDKSGTFKYVQIKVKSESSNEENIVIRGMEKAAFHADVSDKCCPQIEKLGFKTDTIGGGRIKHDPENKLIVVYGYSIGFGKADHRITVSKLKKKYPDYTITWTDEGY